MAKEVKKEVRVLFWHNDFPDGSKTNSFFGNNGIIFKKVLENIPTGLTLKWHFHGGFISSARFNLLSRLNRADVLICGTPSNMDINNNEMHWEEAEMSLFEILKPVKKKRDKLKIFFVSSPISLKEKFEELDVEILKDIHDQRLYDYFKKTHNLL